MHAEVCTDESCNGAWLFDGTAKHYFRKQPDGTTSAIIAGKFLPDPDALWQKRLDMYDVARNSAMGQKLKPTDATFALWQHWQGVKADADKHN